MPQALHIPRIRSLSPPALCDLYRFAASDRMSELSSHEALQPGSPRASASPRQVLFASLPRSSPPLDPPQFAPDSVERLDPVTGLRILPRLSNRPDVDRALAVIERAFRDGMLQRRFPDGCPTCQRDWVETTSELPFQLLHAFLYSTVFVHHFLLAMPVRIPKRVVCSLGWCRGRRRIGQLWSATPRFRSSPCISVRA